jgi:para-aminobenzoate synthetase component 1
MKDFPIIYLNSNDGTGLLAFGDGSSFELRDQMNPLLLQQFVDDHANKYRFGYLSYDLKDPLCGVKTTHTDQLDFPLAFFWVPKYVVRLMKEHVEFLQGDKNVESLEFIEQFLEEETDQNFHHYNYEFLPRISKEAYIDTVNTLKGEIQQGNIYEVNFCQEFYAEQAELNFPLDTYFKLNHITQAPYSSFFQYGKHTVFCGSPERFLSKKEKTLISQPIKGTAARGTDEVSDQIIREQLANDPKERSENIMIVDLVRNDLSRVAEPNTVHVDELCAIYTYETVHQMISTISCDLRKDTRFIDILHALFPMGSMTGAPKLRAMQLIEEHEVFKRGLYSGSIGYMKPDGDFDFNVVIRTLLHNAETNYMSCAVGSAITIQSDPEKEYEECLVKVKRILDGINA